MAKQLTINDPTTGVTYTLEYTRKTVEAMASLPPMWSASL